LGLGRCRDRRSWSLGEERKEPPQEGRVSPRNSAKPCHRQAVAAKGRAYALARFGNPGLGPPAHGEAGEAARGPSGLEIEAAGHAVDVEDFACEVQARAEAAFHRFKVNLA